MPFLGIPKGWKAYATYSFGSHGIEKVTAEAELAYNHAGTDEIHLWIVCGEESDLGRVCRQRGWIGTPAHQQAYLRNVGGKRATRYAEVTTYSHKSNTLPDCGRGRRTPNSRA